MYMDRNALYNVQNSANGVLFPVLMKASLLSGRGYKRVWWTNCCRNHRPVGAFTGQCTKKTCPNTSIYPSSSPDCEQECFALAARKEFWERWLVWYVYAWCLSKGLVGALRTSEPEFVHPS